MTSESAERSALIEGMGAGVLSARELAINIGANDGVKNGMKFKILAEEPAVVRDPGTDEVLGSVDREKARVRIVETQEKFSIGRTYDTAEALSGLEDVFHQVIKARRSDYLPPLSEQESYVKKGDKVVRLQEDDES